ncbi:Taf2p [Maudiozyma barnettii]|uniref:Transcription initiation factor TFIID subunit 2 n=1 Tax=Maudiozyma barnettii TaxID=61262 RepID=A0A8H2VDI1_9SACH|nr:Taf2p [Kazachstania barnettii]CAB4253303.1 similar to Saccharomyces cerevisiae YCR042C TAF2 TFIID subunit (150 kDa), involved in RNA polymerase II transcription initiation [Kazachstania barnettii]
MSYSIGATPKNSSAPPFAFDNTEVRTIKIAHERVQLDVNMSTHQIKGVADVILIPLVQNLDYITLDCKDVQINDVWVENRRCDNYIHDNQDKSLREKYLDQTDDILFSDNTIEQSQFFREKFEDLTKRPDDIRKSQLIIKVPSSIRITLQDADSLSNYTPITPSVKGTPAAQESVFTPLTVKIEYEINNPQTGIMFDTVLEDSPHLWNVYTTNAEFCTTASYWMPCINMLDEKSTWEIEISVPRKVKDIGTSKMIGQKEENVNSILMQKMKKNKQGENENNEDDEEDDDDEEMWDEVDTNNPLNRDIVVCCSEYSTVKEFAHPTDISKKVFAFQIFNPVAPPHIGWAIGAFDYLDLPSVSAKDGVVEEEHEENDENINHNPNNVAENDATDDIPIRVYTLPTKDVDEKMIINSTIVCQRIMDFYSRDFGSYPFASYSLVFLPTVVPEGMDFASLTIFNTRLLYPPSIIDPMFSTTDKLAWALANQWSGVNITPNDVDDIWCCMGMAGFMVFQAIKKLYGQNELRYRLKLFNEAIVDQDWEMQPLGSFFTDFSRPISITSGDLDFIKLKAPMVLYILDKRMTKTERSFGMSRVLPKIFLQAMSGDLPNNSLTAGHFQHVCERVNKNKLESFFQQWIYGSGVPIFRVTQRFNKKRMVVEMGIRQCQREELGEHRIIGSKGFARSALNYVENPYRNVERYFTGSMTIRINEADGTPYEHIVEINDIFTKIDIQYNTKFRRTRGRGPSTKSNSNLTSFIDDHVDERDDDIIRLGAILETQEDCKEWNLTNIFKNTEGHEMQAQNEAYEWIRIDSDFEWISKIMINQPDYMYASQLQQDVDVEAQIESIRYYEDVIATSLRSSLVYSSLLTRTIMDDKYFYGVRLEACRALSKFIYKGDENFPGGARHLVKIFQKLFCFDGSNVPKSNNFEGIPNYLIQKKLVESMGEVRNEHDESPAFVKEFLLGLLKYNDNSTNFYSDHIYLRELIKAVTKCCIHDKEDTMFHQNAIEQLNRYSNLDKWSESYDFSISREILIQKLNLTVRGLYDFDELNDILERCFDLSNTNKFIITREREGIQDMTIACFKAILINGGIKNTDALTFFFECMCSFSDIYVRLSLVNILVEALNFVVENKFIGNLDDDFNFVMESIIPSNLNPDNEDEVAAFIMEDISTDIYRRMLDSKRKNIRGILKAVRHVFRDYKPLKGMLWSVLHTPLLNIFTRKVLFDFSRILYRLENKFEVILPAPRMKKLAAKDLGEGKVVIKRDGIMKLHIKAVAIDAPTNKLKITLPPVKPKNIIKIKTKKPKNTVKKVGTMPVRFVKLSYQYRKIDVSSVPFSDKVTFPKVNTRSFTVKINYSKKT